MSAKVEIDTKTLGAKAVLLDIEGTTTSLSFVKDVLFPYVKENVEAYLKENFASDEVKQVVAALREQAIEDVKSEVEGAIAIADDTAEEAEQISSIVKNIEWNMSVDRKTGSLKTLQGLIYPKGYKDGKIKAQVYEDVPKALEQWVSTGHKVFIYSSGSVDAQKLLFANTEQGDLSAHIAGYFDTAVGAKVESKSYVTIAKEIDFSPEEIVFLTDIVKEAEAAKEAGVNVVLLSRPGNAELTDEDKAAYPVIKSFADIPLEAIGGVKRKIDEVTPETPQDTPVKLPKIDETPETTTVETTSKMETDATDAPVETKTVEPVKAEETNEATPAELVSTEKKALEKIEEKVEEKMTVDSTETVEEKKIEEVPTETKSNEKEVELDVNVIVSEKLVEKVTEESVVETATPTTTTTEPAGETKKENGNANGHNEAVKATNGEEKVETENGSTTNGHVDEAKADKPKNGDNVTEESVKTDEIPEIKTKTVEEVINSTVEAPPVETVEA